jgi:hypothetical protein
MEMPVLRAALALGAAVAAAASAGTAGVAGAVWAIVRGISKHQPEKAHKIFFVIKP